MPAIFAPVSTAPIINQDGTANSQLILFLNQLLNRVGGTLGGTYSKLTVNTGVVQWDVTASPVAVVTLGNGANVLTTLNLVAGAPPYRITFIQPAAGAAGTIVWAGNVLFPGGVAPTLSTGNNAIDQLWFSSDGTNLYLCVEALNFSA